MGNYPFNAGTYSVELTAGGDGRTVADAIRLERGNSPGSDCPFPIADTENASFVGPWQAYSSGEEYGSDFKYCSGTSGANTATWTLAVPEAGTYSVYAWWTSGKNRATNAPYTINYAGGSETVRVSQHIKGSQWNCLGTYHFAKGEYSVVLSDDANGYVIADAIKFERDAASKTNRGYGIWVNSTAKSKAIQWSGSNTVIDGDVHSNNDFKMSGSSNRITGTLEYVSTYTISGNNPDPDVSQVSPEPFPVPYGIDDYKPGGSAANAAGENYHNCAGNFHVSDPDTTLAGLYYVTGDVKLSGSNLRGMFTIVSEGAIHISGSNHNYAAYADDLLFLTNGSSLKLSGSENSLSGSIYVPKGTIHLSGSSNTLKGGLYSDTIKVSGSKNTIKSELKDASPASPYPFPIADNPDADCVGSWQASDRSTEQYGADVYYHAAGGGANTATWTIAVPKARDYRVYAWWTAHANRATNAPYTINYAGGSETVEVAQQINGGQWNCLGNYYFDEGVCSVELSDDANGYVIADAIKFERENDSQEPSLAV